MTDAASSSPNPFAGRPIAQVAIVCHDIEATADAYADLLGLPRPAIIVSGSLEEANTRHNGRPTEARAKLAFFDFGNISLELIEPDKHPSTWREHLDAHGESVHHLAFRFEDSGPAVEHLRKAGAALQQTGDFPGGNYAYLDTTGPLKIVLELLGKR